MRRYIGYAVELLIIFLAGAVLFSNYQVEPLTISAEVSAASHEVDGGYFNLGQELTLLVQPDTDLHRFLLKNRLKRIKVTFTEQEFREHTLQRR